MIAFRNKSDSGSKSIPISTPDRQSDRNIILLLCEISTPKRKAALQRAAWRKEEGGIDDKESLPKRFHGSE
jgi:hypothetical protein